MNSIAQTRRRGRAYKALRGALSSQDLTQKDLPRATGLSQSAVDARMAGRVAWSIPHAYQILRYLHLPAEDIDTYFPEDPWEDVA